MSFDRSHLAGIRASFESLPVRRSEERDDEPDVLGDEVATDLVSALYEHCLVKGGARSCASSMKVAL